MSTKVEKSIEVGVPVSTAYNQWTQFEDFPHFMDGVESVTQLSDDRLKWVAHIAGVRREWEAKILEQIPDRRVAWAAISGATNSGAVEFEGTGGGRTSIKLTLEYQPEGAVEKLGNMLHIVARQAEHDLKKFKKFIEHEGHATGAWRGTVPGGAAGRAGTAGRAAAGTAGMDAGTAEAGTVQPSPSDAVPADAGTADATPPYNRFAHPFDQTNGLVDFGGESDETAEGENYSAAERYRQQHRNDGHLPPMGGGLGQH